MKKLLLIALCLTSLNVYAYDPYGDYMQREYQEQSLKNQRDAIDQQRIQNNIAQSQAIENDYYLRRLND